MLKIPYICTSKKAKEILTFDPFLWCVKCNFFTKNLQFAIWWHVRFPIIKDHLAFCGLFVDNIWIQSKYRFLVKVVDAKVAILLCVRFYGLTLLYGHPSMLLWSCNVLLPNQKYLLKRILQIFAKKKRKLTK